MAIELRYIGSFPRDQLVLTIPGTQSTVALTTECFHWQNNPETGECPDCKTSGWRITENGEAILALAEFAAWLQRVR